MDLGSDSGQDAANRSSINEKIIPSWRAQRYGDDAINENDPHAKYFDTNGNVNGCIENGHRSAFYKRTPLTDKYAPRENGLRKAPPDLQENGNKTDFHDVYEDHSPKQNQFR